MGHLTALIVVTRELKSASSSRFNLSYKVRKEMKPDDAMKMLLLNILHGAADGLKTTRVEDKKELKEMARKNALQ